MATKPNIEAEYPIHSLFANRWSPRAFADQAVEPKKLHTILEAARWAASSFNEQPWRFVIGRKDEDENWELIHDLLVPGNQSWAGKAPVLILLCAKTYFDRNRKPNPHALHDSGMALSQLTLQGLALDLYVHCMAGFDRVRAREVFAMPEGFEAVTAVAVGYLGDPMGLPEKIRDRELLPQQRKPQSDWVAWDKADDIWK